MPQHDPQNIYDTPHGPDPEEEPEVPSHAGINRRSVHRNWVISGSLLVLTMAGLSVLVYIYAHRLEVSGEVVSMQAPVGDLEFLPTLNSNRTETARRGAQDRLLLDHAPTGSEALTLNAVNMGKVEVLDLTAGLTSRVEKLERVDYGETPALRDEESIPYMMTKLAYELYGKREYDEAVRTLKLALEREPGFMEARELLAVVYLSSNDEGRAIEMYQELINRNPYRAMYHNNIALARMKLGQEKAAERSLLEALRLKTTYSDAKVNLGLLYFKRRAYRDAVRFLTDADVQKTHRDHPGVHYGVGVSLLELGQYYEARKQLQEVIRIKRQRADVYYFIARSYAHENLETKVYAWLELATEFSDSETFDELTAHPAFVPFKGTERFARIRRSF